MKILKMTFARFCLMAMMAFASTAVFAAKPAEMIQAVLDKISAASVAINNGAEDSEVATLIKSAADYAEEINANDKVARQNAKATKHFRAAIASARAANLQEAKEHLQKAREIIESLKTML